MTPKVAANGIGGTTFLVAGDSGGEGFIFEFDSAGTVTNRVTFGPSANALWVGKMAVIASNTAYAVLSTYDDAGKFRSLVVKFDTSLQITGWIIIQGSGNNSLNPIDFVETSDGGFVVLAHRFVVGNLGPEDYLSLIKTTSTGTVVKQILFRL